MLKPLSMRQLALWLAVCVCLATPAFAQFDTATVLGTVRDPNGAVLPNVKITLTNSATGNTTNAQTDSEGSYQFINVKIGAYRVSADNLLARGLEVIVMVKRGDAINFGARQI